MLIFRVKLFHRPALFNRFRFKVGKLAAADFFLNLPY
jgi:hypothetical protein